MAGVPGTASAIFGVVKDVGANVIMISQVLALRSLRFIIKNIHGLFLLIYCAG